LPKRSALIALVLHSCAVTEAYASEEAGDALAPSIFALPGFVRLPMPAPFAEGVRASLIGGYGYTEPVLHQGDRHQRALGILSASLALDPHLAIAARYDARYDRHSPGSDSGFTGDGRLAAIARAGIGGGFHAGIEAIAWFPGGETAPSLVLDATSIDLAALFGWSSAEGTTAVALLAGFRIDESRRAFPDVERLSLADRTALELSSAHAVLLGLGASHTFGAIDLFAEGTWDLLVGERAPSALQSPLRVNAGGRWALTFERTLFLGLIGEASLSERPAIALGAPLVPVEPRVSVFAQLAYVLPFSEPRVADSPQIVLPEHQPPPPPPPPVLTGSLRAQVLSRDGAPLEGAAIEVATASTSTRASCDARGVALFPGLRIGAFTLRAEKDGYLAGTATGAIVADQIADLEIRMAPRLPEGEIRGTVRSFSGQPLRAKISVEPIGASVEADAQGDFMLSVAPGTYSVVIRAPGYREQRRRVKVEEQGVTVLNADLVLIRQRGRR
jgi:hypothetical protein